MAQDKKSFLLYADNYSLIKQLPDDVAGKLLKHIFSYVNDENPISDDLLLNIAFEPIKNQLKRDLKKYEISKEIKSQGGRLGNLKRWNLDLYNQVLKKEISIEDAEKIAENRKVSHSDVYRSHSDKNIAVNDNVNVSVNVNDNVSTNVDDIEIKNFDDDINLRHAKILKFESPTWIESVAMQQKISIEEIKNKIDDFVLFLKTLQKVHNSKNEFIAHFINWIPKKIEKNHNPTKDLISKN